MEVSVACCEVCGNTELATTRSDHSRNDCLWACVAMVCPVIGFATGSGADSIPNCFHTVFKNGLTECLEEGERR